jgi:hypothetical protein
MPGIGVHHPGTGVHLRPESVFSLGRNPQPHTRYGDQLRILVNFKCTGEPKQDLDLLLVGTFGSGLPITSMVADERHKAKLVNIVAIIEVKDVPAERTKVEAGHVKVLYKDGWSDSTTQVQLQMQSLVAFLKRGGIDPPYIARAVWLRNVSSRDLPDTLPSNVLCGKSNFQMFCDLLFQVKPPIRAPNGEQIIVCAKNDRINAAVEIMRRLGKSFQPTPLDRRRLEKIGRRLVNDQRYVTERGNQLLAFRGRGGSGKTIHLIRLAKGYSDDYNERVLLLTYNHALAADIRRLLTLMGIQDSVRTNGIVIETAESFFVGIIKELCNWNYTEAEKNYKSYYKAQKAEVLRQVANMNEGEVRDLLHNDYDKFGWDAICIDEAQDWPEDERDLLFAIYGPTRCIIADGIDQLVRETTPCEWAGHPLVKGRKQVVPLRRSLRLASNLCRFVHDFATTAGLDWDQDSNDELLGGRVIIVEGLYTKELHDEIMGEHIEKGNYPVDSLFCLPPEIENTGRFAGQLQQWGLKVWDGTRTDVRQTFPTDRDEYRVVRYESCRGLEGWTVVCLDFDRFFENKLCIAPSEPAGGLFVTTGEARRHFAASWCVIPLTRAINSLVLQVSPGTELRELLFEMFKRHEDFVDWRRS